LPGDPLQGDGVHIGKSGISGDAAGVLMKVSDLITIIREDYCRDTNTKRPEWTDASLIRKFDAAQKQACNRANLLFDDTTTAYTRITLVSGRASYDIDPRVTTIEGVIFDGDKLTQKTQEELDRTQPTWRTDTGMLNKTVYFVIRGRKIRFNYVPDATDAGEVITLEVYRLPDEDIKSTSQEPELPEENHRDLIYWVLHENYRKQDADDFNQEKSDYFLGRFTEIFGPFVPARVRQHQMENPRSTTVRPTAYTSGRGVVTDFDYDL
jgi:hypothetical protein